MLAKNIFEEKIVFCTKCYAQNDQGELYGKTVIFIIYKFGQSGARMRKTVEKVFSVNFKRFPRVVGKFRQKGF